MQESIDIVTRIVSPTETHFTLESLNLGAVSVPQTLFAWGLNHDQKGSGFGGQLGLGDIVDRSSPTQLGAPGRAFQKLGTGFNNGLMVNDGKLYTCGLNFSGELGLGDTVARSVLTQVGALTTWAQAVGGDYFSTGIMTNGKLYTWGANNFGQLGQNDRVYRSSPTQVGLGTNWATIQCGAGHSLAITTDGKLYSWGLNNKGQLGLGDITYRSSPVQIGTEAKWARVAGGFNFSFGVTKTGRLYSWGYNSDGELGVGDVISRSSPVQIGSLTSWVDVCASGGFWGAGLMNNGRVYAWGSNGSGNLAQGDTVRRSSPVQVGVGKQFKKVVGCDFTMALIDTYGRLFTVGNNLWGQLGIGTSGAPTNVSNLVQVGALTSWTDVIATYYGFFAKNSG